MSVMMKRWYRSRRNQVTLLIIIALVIVYYVSVNDKTFRLTDLDLTRRPEHVLSVRTNAPTPISTYNIKHRPSVLKYIESRLQAALAEEKGSGCEIPQLDPFAKEITELERDVPDVFCPGKDWVKCYLSKCKVVPEILASTKNIKCDYYDIIFDNDLKHHLGAGTRVFNSDVYTLTASDHVKILCSGTDIKKSRTLNWEGYCTGFRTSVKRKPVPKGRENTFNVLMFGFDSTSKNCFIRRMPKSYKYLSQDMKAAILNGYNIVGDGTPAAMFPLLIGKTELELPDVRKNMHNNVHLDVMPFLFYKLADDGYRTAYFEDMPWIGTFQYRFNGFLKQPTDHYLRSFYLEAHKTRLWKLTMDTHCIGETPQYQMMMNITDQFLHLDGKKFIFTFIADITHDNINMIATADDAMVHFLKTLVDNRVLEDTLVIVMADHGPRYAKARQTLQGKLEERLPLMALILPERLKRQRPDVQAALEANVNALTTPHDIHATILDVLEMKQHQNPFKVAGADMPRGMSLLEPIPRNRSCSEAGIEPHWCACVSWHNVSTSNPIYQQAVDAFIKYINSLTEDVRSECVPRTLLEVHWVMQQQGKKLMLQFDGARDKDGYVGKFNARVKYNSENYQLKVVVGPGRGVYEATMKYLIKEKKFVFDSRYISRTNMYGDEPSCISAKLPHLNPYCYCKKYLNQPV